MKELPLVLWQYLDHHKSLASCDLYTLTLLSGEEYHYAAYDKDVVCNEITYSHKPFHWARDQIKLQGAPSVDTLQVTVYSLFNDKLGLDSVAYLKKQCHDGALDQAELKLSRAYFDNGECIAVMDLFRGRVEVDSVGGLQVKLTCKSIMQGLAGLIPTRIFASQSAYALNDKGIVTTLESDKSNNMVIPLKPSGNVLVQV